MDFCKDVDSLLNSTNLLNLVYKYVQVSKGDPLDEIADRFKDKMEYCLKNETVCLIVSNLLKKMTNGFSSELILYLRPFIISLIDLKNRKDLVRAYIELGTDTDLEPLVNHINENFELFLKRGKYEYIIFSFVEFEKTSVIDKIIGKFCEFLYSNPENSLKIVKCEDNVKSLQLLFLKSSEMMKIRLRDCLVQNEGLDHTETRRGNGRSLFELISRYFDK